MKPTTNLPNVQTGFTCVSPKCASTFRLRLPRGSTHSTCFQPQNYSCVRSYVSFANVSIKSRRLKAVNLARPPSCLQTQRKNQTYVHTVEVESTNLPKTPGSTTILVLPDVNISKQFPVAFSASDFPGLAKGDEGCEKCSASKMLYVVVTNFNAHDTTTWTDHPVVFDAFRCPACSNTRLRGISATEYEGTMNMGIQYAKQKKYREAEYCLRKAANSWCHFTAAQINLGNFFFQQFVEELSNRIPDQNVLDRAAKFCKDHYLQAFKLSQRIPSFVYRHLGMIYREHDNDYNESNNYLKKYLEHSEVEPHQIETIKAIVEDNEASIQLPASMKVLEEYLVFNPEESASMVAPKPIDTEEDAQRIETAANTISDLLKRSKKANHSHHFMVAKAYQAINQEQKANAHFQFLHQNHPQNPDFAREYSLSCLNLGRLEESLKSAKAAVDLRPNDSELQSNLALVLLFANQLDKALFWVNKALTSRPEDEITKNVYNLIMNVKNQNKPVEEVLKDYMASSPENK